MKNIKKESECLWRKEKEENNWQLPKKAFFIFRLPIIRYFRWFYHNIRIYGHANMWAKAGIGFGGPNQYDLWVLYAISRGWC